MTSPRIYLAGPTVFWPDAKREGERLKAICREHGVEGIFPLDAAPDLPPDGLEAVRMIRAACHAMIRTSDAVVADLSPFRGPHCNDGTALELGIALERGIPVFGYASDLTPLARRIVHTIALDNRLRDAEMIEVEDFGQPFSAMIAGALAVEPFASAEAAIGFAARYLIGGLRL